MAALAGLLNHFLGWLDHWLGRLEDRVLIGRSERREGRAEVNAM
jgi:hypothetical protein